MGNVESRKNETSENPNVKQSFTNIVKNIDKLNTILKDCDVEKPPSINVTINGQDYRITFKNFKHKSSLEKLQCSKNLINDIEITKLNSNHNSIIDSKYSQKDIQNLENIENLDDVLVKNDNNQNTINVSSSMFLNDHSKKFQNKNPSYTENQIINQKTLKDSTNLKNNYQQNNNNSQSGIQIMESDQSQKENQKESSQYEQYWQEPYFRGSKQKNKPSHDQVYQPLGEKSITNIKSVSESVVLQQQAQNLQMISPTKAPLIPEQNQVQNQKQFVKVNLQYPNKDFKPINGIKKSPSQSSRQFPNLDLNSHFDNSTQCTTSINQQYIPFSHNLNNNNKSPNFIDNSQDTHNSYFFQQRKPQSLNNKFSNTGTHFKNKSEQNFMQTARNYNKTSDIYNNNKRNNSTSRSPYGSNNKVHYHSTIKNYNSNKNSYFNQSACQSPHYFQTSINHTNTDVSPRYFSQKQSQISIPLQVLTPTKQPVITNKVEGESSQKKQLIEDLRKNIANNIEKLSNVLTIQQQLQNQQYQEIPEQNPTQSSPGNDEIKMNDQSNISNAVLMFTSNVDSQIENNNQINNNNNYNNNNNVSGIQSKKLIFESTIQQSNSLVTDSYDDRQNQQDNSIKPENQIQYSQQDDYDMETSLFSDHFQQKQQNISVQKQIPSQQQSQILLEDNQQIFEDIDIKQYPNNSNQIFNNQNQIEDEQVNLKESQQSIRLQNQDINNNNNYNNQIYIQDDCQNVTEESSDQSSQNIQFKKDTDENQLTEDASPLKNNSPVKIEIQNQGYNDNNSIIQTDSVFINEQPSQHSYQHQNSEELEKSIQQFENSDLHKELEEQFAQEVENRKSKSQSQSKNLNQFLPSKKKLAGFNDSVALSQERAQALSISQEEEKLKQQQQLENDKSQNRENLKIDQEIPIKQTNSIFNKIKEENDDNIEQGYKPCIDENEQVQNNLNLIEEDCNNVQYIPTENDDEEQNQQQENNNNDNFYQDLMMQYGSLIDNNNHYSQNQNQNNKQNQYKQIQPQSHQSSQQDHDKSQKYDISPNTSNILTKNAKKDKKSEIMFIQYNDNCEDIIEESFVVLQDSPDKQNNNNDQYINPMNNIDDDVNLGLSQENVVVHQSIISNNYNENQQQQQQEQQQQSIKLIQISQENPINMSHNDFNSSQMESQQNEIHLINNQYQNQNIKEEQTPQFKSSQNLNTIKITQEDLQKQPIQKKDDIRSSQTVLLTKKNQNAQFIQDFWKFSKLQKENKNKNKQKSQSSQIFSKERKKLESLDILQTDSIIQEENSLIISSSKFSLNNNNKTPVSQSPQKGNQEKFDLKNSTFDPNFVQKMFEEKRKNLENVQTNNNNNQNSTQFDTTPQKILKTTFDQILTSKKKELESKKSNKVLKSILCSPNKSKFLNNDMSESYISNTSKRVSFKLTNEQELQQRKGNFVKFLKKAKHKIDPNSLRLLRFNTIHLVNVKPLSLRRGSTPSFMDYKNQKKQSKLQEQQQQQEY